MTYKIVLIAALFYPALLAENALAAPNSSDESFALSSFKIVVGKYEKFFSARPTLLSKTGNPYAKSGVSFQYMKFESSEFSYDVRKNDSLVSPFVGYITMGYKYWLNRKCGDITSPPDHAIGIGFTTPEAAASKNDDTCYPDSIQDIARFSFAFQEGKWMLKGLETTANQVYGGVPVMAAALGLPVREGFLRIDDIGTWKQLLTN